MILYHASQRKSNFKVLYDWMRKCPTVVKRINDMVVDIKEIVASDTQHFQLGCLSETAIYFLEARC